MSKNTLISLVIPVFNEEAALPAFFARIEKVFTRHAELTLEMIFVNDGSSDGTQSYLRDKQGSDSRIVIVELSRQFGKEAALSAGLATATGDAVIPLDADLQDPPELIPRMIAKWREGYDVVLGRRVQRKDDSWAKRISASWYYRVHNMVADRPLPENAGDFRLMDRCVVDALNTLPESCRFMKGLFAWVGFRTTSIDFARQPRVAGTRKFTAWRLWNFAMDGTTNFSTAPLRIWTYLGFMLAFSAFVFAVFIALRVLISGVDVPGYASIMVTIIFLGGIQLIGMGILGEYLGRNYIESKRRPVFLVKKIYHAQALSSYVNDEII